MIRRRSVTLYGHRTSVSIEDAFWDQLQEIAKRRGISMNALVAEVDEARTGNLSSALRLLAFEDVRTSPPIPGSACETTSGSNETSA